MKELGPIGGGVHPACPLLDLPIKSSLISKQLNVIIDNNHNNIQDYHYSQTCLIHTPLIGHFYLILNLSGKFENFETNTIDTNIKSTF